MGEIEVRALDGVNLKIMEGEFVAIMGPSGSGKSTLMNILGCLDLPTDGSYLLDGEDVSDLDAYRLADIRNRQLGFVFQAYNLLPRLTALENVTLPMLYGNGDKKSVSERTIKAEKALAEVGLSERGHHLPHEMSGGQQQRVAIARALINDPVLVLADEPTGNLDSKSSYDIISLLVQMHEVGRTIVMVTHEPEIAEFAERVIHFRDGKVDQDHKNGKHRYSKLRQLAESVGAVSKQVVPVSEVE
jgi:putative ABC transport system ATP-binding protein